MATTLILCLTTDTTALTLIDPVEEALQFGDGAMTAVPPEDRSDTDRLKLQLGVVLIV